MAAGLPFCLRLEPVVLDGKRVALVPAIGVLFSRLRALRPRPLDG